MKAVIALLLCACAVASAWQYDPKVADRDWLKKEYEILRFFKYVHQPSYYKEHYETAKTYRMVDHLDWYTKPEVVKQFWYYYQQGLLPKGEVFSVFYPDHLKEAIALFKVFYYAKDWPTLWKTAAWARQYVNEGQFIYAFSVALVHRPDTESFILPPIYEVYPYYFYPTEAITQAQKYKQIWSGVYPKQTSSYKGYTVPANYTGWYLNLHPEQSFSYFTEDIGVNAFYWYYNLYYPFWMDSEEYNIKNEHRGEQFYYVHQQLLARYYLERLSGGFGEIPSFSWNWPVETGYYPSLQYPNGLDFPSRPSNADVYKKFYDNYESYAFYYKNFTWSPTYVEDYERRIRDAIDRGFVWTFDGKFIKLYDEYGFETLGNLIESNPESPNSRYYGDLQIFARFILGYSYYPLDKYKVAPSALQHFETSLRDPAFYQLYKRIISYFQKYKNYLGPYKYEELYYPGVEIYGAEFEPLVTYFEKYYSDLSYGVYVNEQEFREDSFQVRAVQDRLTYKPFKFTLKVKSDKAAKSVVRVFIGPKYDEYNRFFNLTYNNYNFVEVDRFTYDLKSGENVISRFSSDSWYAQDYPSFKQLYKDVSAAMEGKFEFKYYYPDAYYGFPSRFYLPKGSESGTPYQFYFIISPWQPGKTEAYEWYWPAGFSADYYDKYAYGYPFDRPIYDESSFYVPNSYFQEVEVYHKDVKAINSPHY